VGRIRVLVVTTDELTRIGLAASLRANVELDVLPEGSGNDRDPDVAVLAPGASAGEIPAALWARVPDVPTVLVADHTVDPVALTAHGVVAVVPRRCPPDELAGRVVAAAALTDADPEQILAVLRRETRPADRASTEVSQRELTVLRMLAEGRRIEDIACELACSERTVRNTVYALVRRLNLRNQAHAVAYAVRAGLV
jgi:DNA-binding NarL/FixJ family response regulator